ncbi:MAG: glycoside hydrolase family 57 protein [bacterium]
MMIKQFPTQKAQKELHVAFVWHMHQPPYKNIDTAEYLMPWVRLHAVKDYLDMVTILENYPKIKQTFNIVPSLLDQLNDYAFNGALDIHSRITVKAISDLTVDEKVFILEHFFDANYVNMVLPHEPYRKLYEKRHQLTDLFIDSFTDQEYSDIIAWFNLVWFDPCWISEDKELKALYEKGKDYSLKDRQRIIEIQRELIRKIIPKYKEMQDKGQIEITTSPYNHPILPLLIEMNSADRAIPTIQLPENTDTMLDDAKEQTSRSIKRYEELFGKKPQGIWLSEQCISPESIELISKMGFKWTITDEGNLSKTIEKEFIRDFHGDLVDPFDLCKAYNVKINDSEIKVLFRNSVLADLIGFEYGNHDPEAAANDLYERIKGIQSSLETSPEKHHIVTIALDGENCWESYYKDGRPFLDTLYRLMSEDETLNVTRVCDFVDKLESTTTLDTIHSGSWINRSFQLWIGDPTKNLAWDYLQKTRNDLVGFSKEKNIDKALIDKAWDELYIAQGSDWFWWYGEPNDSGQDDLFDWLFRMHLQNVYRVLGKPDPEYLQIPLELFVGKPSKAPLGLLNPCINGEVTDENEWKNAGCIDIHQGPMYQSDKLLNRILFGFDKDNIYFRFELNKVDLAKSIVEIYLYSFIPEQLRPLSPCRIRNKGSTIFPSQRYGFANEIEIPFIENGIQPLILSESIEGGLWKVVIHNNIQYEYNSVLEIAIPFDDLGVEEKQEIQFVAMTSKSQILQQIIPHNKAITIKRP